MYLERRYVGSCPSTWGFITDSYDLAAQAAFASGKSRPIGKVAFTASIVFRTLPLVVPAMRRLKERFHSQSPVPRGVAEGTNIPSHSAKSNALDSIIKVLEVAKSAADGVPIKALNAVISSILIVLKSVKVRSIYYTSFRQRLFT